MSRAIETHSERRERNVEASSEYHRYHRQRTVMLIANTPALEISSCYCSFVVSYILNMEQQDDTQRRYFGFLRMARAAHDGQAFWAAKARKRLLIIFTRENPCTLAVAFFQVYLR
ncbi:hypothetical protein TGPRC2_356030 [Toxoplasma gondii TgCatPRC2]|uniref:Uncharacterized protein n=4 Tax=Toxoplasma gondii TaxID=5811 RepID=V4ZC09_TOXGV|nr:hypothetical protein TGVEG_356030 [Toxoplasma gondii VEG]KFH14900.1 hypothetical protein TGMAS_356030 [Toxoplasma gondii MAS]KYF39847.1 hypothetical protein TGARI_356030 [Toxoplasma gondii ARI]KYK66026.1 hypothetical protein TGPRC2_356030 [Toxoplasma gondii TgCatPRC2]